jgi:hypothetical protein
MTSKGSSKAAKSGTKVLTEKPKSNPIEPERKRGFLDMARRRVGLWWDEWKNLQRNDASL